MELIEDADSGQEPIFPRPESTGGFAFMSGGDLCENRLGSNSAGGGEGARIAGMGIPNGNSRPGCTIFSFFPSQLCASGVSRKSFLVGLPSGRSGRH